MKRMLCAILLISIIFVWQPTQAKAAPMEVKAKSALLMDVTTGTVLFEQNAHEALAPASVTKVMTLLLIMEAIDSGAIGWNDIVTASETAAAKGGSQVYLKAGETMTVSDMVKAIAVSSANDCACAMAEHLCGSESAFVDKMNTRAKELGMENTHFVNCTGLDDGENAAQHKTSAYDIALMSAELLKNHPDIKKYTTIWMDTLRNGTFGLSNTNKLIRFYPGATGLKTGFTSNAGYCLSASAQRDGMELVAVVMGAKTTQDRFNACKSLLDYGFANYALIQPSLEQLPTIAVKLGTNSVVEAEPSGQSCLLIEKGQKSQVSTHIELEEQVTAPISQGQRLGTLTIKAGEQVLAQIPMVAKEAVPRLTFGDLFMEMLRHITMAK